ncbi:unnamed protein product [Miscanthus lutarioriparius]|uniref:Uncharacterized protein n=1 Tax=Miscanthus lutarioriparius TaxID=422564 RepID=A0A811NN68_9POAL|nr:unnamed protein product [Miscanthus lutarioriparius]
MAEFFHAGRTNTDDCYDAGKHVHGSRRVYGHDDASRSRPAYAADCYNGGEVGALAAGASSTLKEQKAAAKERRAHDDHFCHHH